MSTSPAPFDLDHFLPLPRLSGLRLSPDGRRLVVSVASPAADGKRFATTIWEVDPDGAAPRRLTRSTKGESGAAFLPDGSLLFVSARPDPDAKPDGAADDGPGALWLLPAGGGEARVIVLSAKRSAVRIALPKREMATLVATGRQK